MSIADRYEDALSEYAKTRSKVLDGNAYVAGYALQHLRQLAARYPEVEADLAAAVKQLERDLFAENPLSEDRLTSQA